MLPSSSWRCAASLGFLTGAEQLEDDMPWFAVLGLITGGVIVAPFAARLAGRLPHHVMGTLVGGLILIVNGQIIVLALGLPVAAGLGLAGGCRRGADRGGGHATPIGIDLAERDQAAHDRRGRARALEQPRPARCWPSRLGAGPDWPSAAPLP